MIEKSFSLNNLKTMEIIDVNMGVKIGYISDFKIDTEHQRVVGILLMNTKSFWFPRNNYVEISWEKIIKIGLDVILIDGSNLDLLQLSN